MLGEFLNVLAASCCVFLVHKMRLLESCFGFESPLFLYLLPVTIVIAELFFLLKRAIASQLVLMLLIVLACFPAVSGRVVSYMELMTISLFLVFTNNLSVWTLNNEDISQ